MKKKTALVLTLLLGAVMPLAAQKCLPIGPERAFQPGESLDFGLMYKWGVSTEVGTANLSIDTTVLNGKPAFHSSIKAKGAPFFDVFFKIREHFQGWMDQDNMRPLKFIRDTHEGNYTATNLFHYDWENHVIHTDLNSSHSGHRIVDVPIEDCTFDIASILYYARCMDLSRIKPGTKYPLIFAIDEDVYHLVLTFRGKETLKNRKLGKIRTLRVSCSVVSCTMFSGEEEFLLWISDDDNRLPVAFVAPIRVGEVKGYLKGYDNLKYPFSSLVK